ncbi:hypothetical protein [Altericista sp. CCNU0014]|uniref:hypothetical protein n=1 Tax=Altericista sp. CCNU0014 TaxID=3082949 RepID=UPI00384A5BA3
MKNFFKENLQGQYGSSAQAIFWQDIQANSPIDLQILAWTNGQPVLTRRIQQLLAEQEPLEKFEKDVATVNKVVRGHFKYELLHSADPRDAEVVKLLRNICDALTQGSSSLLLLSYYKEILVARKKNNYNDIPEQNQLLKIGIVSVDSDGKLTVANPIYKKIFNLDWTEERLERLLDRKRIDKYHLALITGLISVLVFALFQGFTRYAPYARLIQCNGPAFKAAIDANIALDEAKIDRAVSQLKDMQRQQSFSPGCEAILHDLQYSQAIYLRAGIDNNPMEAVKELCNIPEQYYAERNIQPWFARWLSLYRKTSFAADFKAYISSHNCPASDFLSR